LAFLEILQQLKRRKKEKRRKNEKSNLLSVKLYIIKVKKRLINS